MRGRHGVRGKTWCERDVAVDGGDGDDDVVVFPRNWVRVWVINEIMHQVCKSQAEASSYF